VVHTTGRRYSRTNIIKEIICLVTYASLSDLVNFSIVNHKSGSSSVIYNQIVDGNMNNIEVIILSCIYPNTSILSEPSDGIRRKK